MNTKEWTIVIAVVIVIAILASLVSVKMTGNVVNVPISSTSVGVYTKTEVDSKFATINKSLTIDSLDKKCGLVLSSAQNSCHQVCLNKGNLSCMVGQVKVTYKTINSTTEKIDSVIGCTDDPINEFIKNPEININQSKLTDIDMACICCKI